MARVAKWCALSSRGEVPATLAICSNEHPAAQGPRRAGSWFNRAYLVATPKECSWPDP